MDTEEIDTRENRKSHIVDETVTHRITDFDKLLDAKLDILPTLWKSSSYGKHTKNDNGRMPLILVHGWNGDSGMRDPSKLLLWENSEFHYWHNFIAFYLHSEELQKKYHLYLYRYTSYKHIAHSAKIFADLLKEVPSTTDLGKGLAKDKDKDKDGVSIMAHSMGGMVSRAMIEEWDGLGAYAKKLKILITLDTPHRGSVGSMDNVLTNLPKDLDTHGAMDLNYDNFDNTFDASELDEYYNLRRKKNGLEDFDRLYCGDSKLKYATYDYCMEETANPYMKYVNKLFEENYKIYNKKYIFYTAWHTHNYDTIVKYATALATAGGLIFAPVLKIAQNNILDLSKNNNPTLDFINNGSMGIATAFIGKYAYSAGGAESIGSSILDSGLYTISSMKFNPKDTTHPNLSGHEIDNKLYHKDLYVGGYDISLISNSIGKDHPYGIPYRVFWDYDHGTIYEGVATGKGDWDEYIASSYLSSDSTTSDTKFNDYRTEYIKGAMKIRFGKEPDNISDDILNKFNPLEYEPVFMVIEKDLLTSVTNGDIDGDDINDTWEEENGLRWINPDDAKEDFDNDKLTNLEEFKLGTNPNKEDTDGDGYSDSEEVLADTSPIDPLDYPNSQSTDTDWMDTASEIMNWDDAKAYCTDNGGRLPTFEELKAEVVKCGGVIDDWENNANNSNYQSCYKNNGFISSYYWSSTSYASSTNNAWRVDFYNGDTNDDYKDSRRYVRCVRAGQ